MPLPANYKLHPHDVVIGRGHKINQHNDRNPIFQCLLKRYCHEYIDCTKERKSDILKEILREIKLHSTGVGFVKQMTAGPFPYAIASDAQSRTSIAQFLRNEVPENFKSSKQFKQQLRREKKVKTVPTTSSGIKVGPSDIKVKAPKVPSPAPAPSVASSNPAVKVNQPKPETVPTSNDSILQGLTADVKTKKKSITTTANPNDILMLGLRSKDTHSKPPAVPNAPQDAFLSALLQGKASGPAPNSSSAVNALQNLAAMGNSGFLQNNLQAPSAQQQASNGVSSSVLQNLGILQGNVQARAPQQPVSNDILQSLGILQGNVQAPPQVSNDVLQSLGILPSSVQAPPPPQQQVSDETLRSLGILPNSVQAPQQQQVSDDVLQNLGILQAAVPVPQASAPQGAALASLMQQNRSTTPSQMLQVPMSQQQQAINEISQTLVQSLMQQNQSKSTLEAPKPSSSLKDEIMADLRRLEDNAVPEECASETDSISTISGGGLLGQFSAAASGPKNVPFSFGGDLLSTNLAVDLDHLPCHVERPDSPLSIGSPFSFPSPERSDSPLGMLRAESPVVAPFAPERPDSPLDIRRQTTKRLLSRYLPNTGKDEGMMVDRNPLNLGR